MAKNYTIEMNGMKFSAPTQAEAMKMAKEFIGTPTTAGKGKVKDTPFTKHDGTVIMCTAPQAAAYEKYRDGYNNRVANKEANLQAWAEKRSTYKPSQAFVKALKANPTMTHKQAKEQFGFVGTKNDLWNVKYGTDGCVKKGTFNK